jgi:hypothetical protein
MGFRSKLRFTNFRYIAQIDKEDQRERKPLRSYETGVSRDFDGIVIITSQKIRGRVLRHKNPF